MVTAPYLCVAFLALIAVIAQLPLTLRYRPALLALSFAALSLFFFAGAGIAVAVAVILTVATRAFLRWPARLLCGLCLTALMLKFKLPSELGEGTARILPFLVGVPLGFSFQFFSAIGLWIDDSRKPPPRPHNLFHLLGALLFAPALIAGPYVSATYLLEQFRQGSGGRPRAAEALCLLSWGILKKALGDSLAVGILSHFFLGGESSPGALIALTVATVRLYLDFSGYNDAARGAALLLGYDLPQNFDRPFFAQSYADFWSRWNQSLSGWFKSYLFHPLVARYPRFRELAPMNAYLFAASALVTGLIAAWHGINLLFFSWYLMVMAGLWLRIRSPVLRQAFTALWIFLSSSMILSGSLARWGSLWQDVFTGGVGAAAEWLSLLVLAAGLLSIQAVHFGSITRISRKAPVSLALGILCWTAIFIIGFRGRPFVYASF